MEFVPGTPMTTSPTRGPIFECSTSSFPTAVIYLEQVQFASRMDMSIVNEPPADSAEAPISQENPTALSDGIPCTDQGGMFFNPTTNHLYDVYPIGGGFQPIGLRTGFTPPYPSNQILMVLLVLIAIVESYLVMIPSLPVCIVAPIVGTVVTFLFLLTIIFWIRTSMIDPADKRVLKKIGEIIEACVEDGKMQKKSSCGVCLYASMNSQGRTLPKGCTFGSTKFCSLCDTDVHVDSAHCLRCGMCIYRYDHHCFMLNKCIGEENYFDFFRTMLSAWTLSGFLVALHLYTVMELTYVAAAKHPYIGKPTVFGICGAFLSLHVMSCFYLGRLVWSHFELRRKNMTLHEHNLALLKDFSLQPEGHSTARVVAFDTV